MNCVSAKSPEGRTPYEGAPGIKTNNETKRNETIQRSSSLPSLKRSSSRLPSLFGDEESSSGGGRHLPRHPIVNDNVICEEEFAHVQDQFMIKAAFSGPRTNVLWRKPFKELIFEVSSCTSFSSRPASSAVTLCCFVSSANHYSSSQKAPLVAKTSTSCSVLPWRKRPLKRTSTWTTS